ncbi:MAG: type VI secretion system baseplate subunit TssK [Bacteroidetes bacterium]|nr:type VI secretion system baseplate subunit TssK [Bacteroidota bacterium]MBS1629564.1 type VI secretion system baseplate subunit TssK [Bacteroidota bacterium]
MLPKLQHHLTNWVDGMKITRQHFVDSENALIDALRDAQASGLNNLNYGLLQPLPGEKSALDCNTASNQTNSLKITVSYCRAITSGGCRIEIIPGMHPELSAEANGNMGADDAAGFYAVIAVDPFNRQPFGPAASDEYPPRNSSSISAYKLGLVPEDQLDASSLGAFHLPVAKFRLKNGQLVRDAEYIPPCSVIGAHPGAKQIYNAIAERLNQIQESSSEIVRKVVEGGSQQNTPLAQNVKTICEQVIWHIAREFFSFRTLYRQQSPVYMSNSVVQLASIINVSLNLIPVKEKEELLQYFSYWNEVSPGKFEDLLSGVMNADYEHENIYAFFQPLLGFLKTWSDLLDKLKDLKLIGQRNEKFDFGGRTMEAPKEKPKGKFSIFD